MKSIASFFFIVLLLSLFTSTAFCDNDSYDENYHEGYDDGERWGYDNGYDDGYFDGYDEGYDEGYDKGFEDACEVHDAHSIIIFLSVNYFMLYQTCKFNINYRNYDSLYGNIVIMSLPMKGIRKK